MSGELSKFMRAPPSREFLDMALDVGAPTAGIAGASAIGPIVG